MRTLNTVLALLLMVARPTISINTEQEIQEIQVEHEEIKYSRKMGKGSGKKSNIEFLKADIKSLSDDFELFSGSVRIDEDGGDLIINYQLEEGPKQCKDCKIGIFDGKKCNKLKEYRPFYNPDKTENPWKASRGAKYLSNNRRNSAAFVEVYNGRKLSDHVCKTVALFGSLKKDGDDAHKRSNAIGCGVLVPKGEDEDYC